MTIPASETSVPVSAPEAAVVQQPEPAKVDTATETLPAVRPSAEVAAVPKWEHEWLEFGGEKLGIRTPTPQAMSALSMGLGKFVPARTQNDISGLFIARHLSPESFEHVYSRLMDPDDSAYNANTIGELLGAILNAGVAQFEKEAEAEKEAAAAAIEAKK